MVRTVATLTVLNVIFVFAGGETLAAKPIRFGGARQATAEISRQDDRFVVVVRLLPVDSFAAGTNERITLQKARHYALRAIATQVAEKSPMRLSVQGLAMNDRAPEGKFLRLTYQVTASGVHVEKIVEEPRPDAPAKTERPAIEHPSKADVVEVRDTLNVLGRVPDYFDTIEQLAGSWRARLCEIERESQQVEQFSMAVSALQDAATEEHLTLRKAIIDDRLVLKHDTQALVTRGDAEIEAFLEHLAEVDGNFNLNGKDLPVGDPASPPYSSTR